jgi:hypothetical protein
MIFKQITHCPRCHNIFKWSFVLNQSYCDYDFCTRYKGSGSWIRMKLSWESYEVQTDKFIIEVSQNKASIFIKKYLRESLILETNSLEDIYLLSNEQINKTIERLLLFL